MLRMRLVSAAAALLVAAAALAQEKTAPPPAFDADACAKHCKEMAERRQKMMDDRKAMSDRTAGAWKEIRAAVDQAKKARGEKKVAALETALDRLVAFHEQMMAAMPGMAGMHGMSCCGGGPADHPMMHGGPGGMAGCCGGAGPMPDCCAGMHGHDMPDDCPMMKGK